MRIEFEGIHGVLVPESASDRVAAHATRNHFRHLDENRYAVKSFRDGFWDGYHYAISKTGKFLKGMARDVSEFLVQEGVEVKPFDIYPSLKKHSNKVTFDALHGITLWDHQTKIVKSLLESGGGMADSPTGSGKTESISLLVKILLESSKDSVVWFLVHRKGLVNQTCKRFLSRVPEMEGRVGILGDGKKPLEDVEVVFATIQSLSSSLGFRKNSKPNPIVETLWAQSGFVVIDECHRIKGKEYETVLETLGGQVPVFGFSGTPEIPNPVENWKILGMCGPIVIRIPREELEEAGLIAHAVACIKPFQNPHGKIKRSPGWIPKVKGKPYVVKALRVTDEGTQEELINISPYAGEEVEDVLDDGSRLLYPEYARDAIILNEDRNADIQGFVEACNAIDRNVLVVCERVAQVYLLNQRFKKAGFRCDYLFGAHSTNVRDEKKEKFERGEITVLVAGSILDEGEDIQNVGAVVLASGGAPLVRQIQRIGRGVRRKKGIKNWCPVWVSLDSRNRFERDASISRLENLDRAGVSSCEVVGAWLPFLKELEAQQVL